MSVEIDVHALLEAKRKELEDYRAERKAELNSVRIKYRPKIEKLKDKITALKYKLSHKGISNNPKNGYPRSILREVVDYGNSVLGMTDSAMARELCISKQRVHQVRSTTALKRQSNKPDSQVRLVSCPKCNNKMKSTSTVCSKCYRQSSQYYEEKRRRWKIRYQTDESFRQRALNNAKLRVKTRRVKTYKSLDMDDI